MSDKALADAVVAAARQAQANAYAPYSNFRVGAALLAEDGSVHAGCNVENASYGLTICAERSAIACAVAAGVQRFTAIAIATPAPEPCPPCGMCLQTLSEFSEELDVYLVADGQVEETTLRALLPRTFDKNFL